MYSKNKSSKKKNFFLSVQKFYRSGSSHKVYSSTPLHPSTIMHKETTTWTRIRILKNRSVKNYIYRKTDCAHVDHNQLNDPLPVRIMCTIFYNQYIIEGHLTGVCIYIYII